MVSIVTEVSSNKRRSLVKTKQLIVSVEMFMVNTKLLQVDFNEHL